MEGFWGPPTASIDWCEPNYLVSFYVAEWWNTISNFVLFFLGLFGAIVSWKQKLEWRSIILYLCIAGVGLGSAAFHGTLLYSSQLADELPMIIALLILIFILMEMRNTTSSIRPTLTKLTGVS